ncbi:hypothetical protein [Methylobacterium crusticola]|uniref:hypothetical protein n=1 Tax=Methylobacterium crusticola TaxID=1697972 RepID=UPI000FFB9582|nr:hypothetical protein [Methylobacterium crusticola]
MSSNDLAARIDALHPKNAVRILEAIRDKSLLALSDEAVSKAEADMEAFVAELNLPLGWRDQIVTSLNQGEDAQSADQGGQAAKLILKEMINRPELQVLVENNLSIKDDSASVTLALGLPLVVAAAWMLVSGRLRVAYSPERGLEVEYEKDGLSAPQQAKLLPGFVKAILGLAKSSVGEVTGGTSTISC